MQRFTEIRALQRSHAMALRLYELASGLPADQRFGLTSQIRRAAASVPTNIAEGSKRSSALEYARFLRTAEGSLVETEYLLVLSRDLGLISGQEIEGILKEVNEIERMLSALRRAVMQNH
jgi:four helix bundle protein